MHFTFPFSFTLLFCLPFPFLTEMLVRKCGPDKTTRMQPPSVPVKPRAVKEPVPEAKGYEEIRARIKK